MCIRDRLTEEQFARKLSQAVEHLDDLVARIAQGEGTIGKLISDPEPVSYTHLDVYKRQK